MKKFLFIALLLVLFVAPHVFAADGYVPLAPIQGLTDANTAGASANLAVFFNNLYKFLIGIAAAIAVIEIIYGGFEISTKDSVSKQSDGRERIQKAILGLILVLSPVLVFSIINPSILNLSLNLDKLDTTSGPALPPPGGTIPGTSIPVCGPQVQNGCVNPPGKTGGPSPLQVPGWWCFAIAPWTEPVPGRGEIQYNFTCAESRFYCEQQRNNYPPVNIRGTCSAVGTPTDMSLTVSKSRCSALKGEAVDTTFTCAGASSALRKGKSNCWDLGPESSSDRQVSQGICIW